MKVKVGFLKSSNTIPAKLIKMWTNSPYSHVELIFKDVCYKVDVDTVVMAYTREEFEEKNWDTIEIDIVITEDQEEKIYRFFQNQLGLEYDWTGIFLSQFISLGINSENKWFCSELVTKILQLLLVEEVLDCEPNKVSPGKLYKMLENYIKPESV